MNPDINSIKKRFLALNRERLKRTQESLRWKQRDFLELLPLMFHINHPMLPGYISKNTPAGIPDYLPGEKSIDAAKRFAKTFFYKKRALLSYEIQSIFLMGSSGTVAHSDKSDFDIWICHKPGLDKKQITELSKKATAIEEWAATIDLDIHFFLMDAENFKKGDHVDLSDESSGTAQHHLLLEEFYRTSLLVAGRYPIWWLVPPEHENNYDDYVNDLLTKRFIKSSESIDFGGLGQIPADEFFGAALWQVYKGIDSPYKSALKILLMETYANEFPTIDLLSLRFKKAIYAGEKNLDRLDPYVMLISKLEEYLIDKHDHERLDLIRRCFYFKVNMQLSIPSNTKHSHWRRELIHHLAHQWGWNDTTLSILDSRDKWKIHRVLKERKILVNELTNSYLFLSKFARNHTRLAHISQSDLNILGRKLYAAFERKPGKIDIVNRGIAPNLLETHLLFQQAVGQDGKESWMLFHGADSHVNTENNAPLKRGPTVVGLLSWCHFNKLMNARTAVAVRSHNDSLDIKEVNDIRRCFQQYYADGNLPDTDMESLSKRPTISSSLLFINVGLNPIVNRNSSGNDIISNRTNIFNYSGFSFNLAMTFDLVLMTSWQEIYTYSYSGINGLMECICQYLQWNDSSFNRTAAPTPNVFCFSSNHGMAIARRIEELFSDITDFFREQTGKGDSQYILECEQSYYIIKTENERLRFLNKNNYHELVNYLAEPQRYFSPTHIDRSTLANTLLPIIFRFNKPNTIQLFYLSNDSLVDIYVVDECGSLFYQQSSFFDDDTLINQFDQFFDSILNRRNLTTPNGVSIPHGIRVEFFQLTKNKIGKYALDKRFSNRGTYPKRYFNIQVIGNVEEGNTVFTIYCDDAEFSSYEYGSELFKKVAQYVVNLRLSGLRYPIHITDIDLSPVLLNENAPNKLQTINFLNYKKRIEDKLNRELENL